MELPSLTFDLGCESLCRVFHTILARANAVFPSANDKSRAPKAKKVSDEEKKLFITRAMHVSEHVLNRMFQVGYSRTLVLF